MSRYGLLLLIVVSAAPACALRDSRGATLPSTRPAAVDPLERAVVWQPRRISAANMRTGPTGPGSFRPHQTIRCVYVRAELGGNTPKFACELPNGDELKVKYGRTNGEVFAEVAATRILWALGFGADRMYPVRVECRGCPEGGIERPGAAGVRFYEYAAVERQLAGRELKGPAGEGWAWTDLDRIHPEAGPAALAHRDALKLLAVILQHTDTKPEQQRLICLDRVKAPDESCERPFLMISDLGRTFGRATLLNRDGPSSVNLEAWAQMPVWKGTTGCVGNLPRSMSGTLDDPPITDAGRLFLSSLLQQLTDRQLRELFTVARFPERRSAGDEAETGSADEWVRAFKAKVQQVVTRSCVPSPRS